MLFIGIITGVIVGLLILLFLRERSGRQYATRVSDDLREYTGSLRLRLLQAAEDFAAERKRCDLLTDAVLNLAAQRDDALDDLADADELIEELEDIAEEALDGWARADSIAERAVTIAERATGGL